MKIVDQTPFYNGKDNLSLIDRVKAFFDFGPGWFKQVEAQKLVIAVLKKNLDKNYTLLVNVTPPGLEARIPLILVGPTGIYVMSVTPKIGTFRARGDQWGTVSGNSLRPDNPNLLVLTEKMARAIQIYIQRQGYADLNNVEAVLLCSDPAMNVDSMRPIIRVIMRDALERFVVSVTQARIVLTPESAYDIVNRLLTPPAPPPSNPAETPAPEPAPATSAQPAEPSVPAYAVTPPPAPASPFPSTAPEAPAPPAPRPRARSRLTPKQILILVIMLVVWCVIIVVFAFLIARNMNPSLFIPK